MNLLEFATLLYPFGYNGDKRSKSLCPILLGVTQWKNVQTVIPHHRIIFMGQICSRYSYLLKGSLLDLCDNSVSAVCQPNRRHRVHQSHDTSVSLHPCIHKWLDRFILIHTYIDAWSTWTIYSLPYMAFKLNWYKSHIDMDNSHFKSIMINDWIDHTYHIHFLHNILWSSFSDTSSPL